MTAAKDGLFGTTAGYITTTGAHVCRDCADAADGPNGYGVGRLDHSVGEYQRIVHPAPDGIFRNPTMVDHYDQPCGICGWAIRQLSRVTA